VYEDFQKTFPLILHHSPRARKASGKKMKKEDDFKKIIIFAGVKLMI